MKIQRQAAVMFASDLPRTIKYWNEQIGFATHGTFLEPPVFAIMERDANFVMLKQLGKEDAIIPYSERNEGLWNAYFWVDDVASLFEELRKRGAVMDYGPCDQPYGVREFAIRDPDQQTIGFGQVLNTANGAPP
jgi:catechol 2,3-dioxygenase-like lactoylglutathione lyase family enzyme